MQDMAKLETALTDKALVAKASVAVIDKSLDLEKISRRNESIFSLSSWRNDFSFLFFLSIFKNSRKKFSFSSRFMRFYWAILVHFSIFKTLKKNFSFSSRFMRFYWAILVHFSIFKTLKKNFSFHSRLSRLCCTCFSFSSSGKWFILERNMHYSGFYGRSVTVQRRWQGENQKVGQINKQNRQIFVIFWHQHHFQLTPKTH